MKTSQHNKLCKKVFGVEFKEINNWMNEKWCEKIRHSSFGIEFCKENWGIVGEAVAKFHLLCDSIIDIPKIKTNQNIDYYGSKKNIHSTDHIKNLYEIGDVVNNYVKSRFQTPLGKAQHQAQINFINKCIKNFNLKIVMDLACGCARLGKDIYGFEEGVGFDNSEKMLELARKIDTRWKFIKGDAFNFKIKDKFDLIFSGRFIKHFKLEDRKRIYSEIYKALKDNGYFIMDINNYKFAYLLRMKKPKEYDVYDELWFKRSIKEELESNGFKDVDFYGILNQYNTQRRISWLKYMGFGGIAKLLIMFFEKFKSDEPFEWMVIARKK